MKKLLVLFLLMLLAGPVTLPAPAQAVEKGAAELGLFGRVTWFDPAFELADWGGFGVRAGYFLARDLALEADASFTSTDGIVVAGERQDVQVMPFHARLVWNPPVGEKTNLLLGAGYLHTEYGDDVDGSGDGAGALVGFRYAMSPKMSFRLSATADWYTDNDFTEEEDPLDFGAQFGFSGLFGNGPGDRDNDGVTDDLDRCPDTPRGDDVDANGCTLPKDLDGDGVMDNVDKCPDTPRGDRVDASGCSLPRDTDGDGVTDDLDKCPGTPRGDRVDASGCSLPRDTDGDGVTDNLDKCPGTAPGTRVDANGCELMLVGEKATLVLEGVNFATNSAELTPEAREILDGIAVKAEANPTLRMEVAGHTDSTGSRSYNLKLSQRRAASVRDYLISKGVAADRMVAKGYGPDQPVASNDTVEGRAQNRRIELNRID